VNRARQSTGPATPDLQEIARRILRRRSRLSVLGLRGGARMALLARLVEAAAGRSVLVLVRDAKQADRLVEDLRAALGEVPPEEGGRVRPYPHPDTPPYDRFSPQLFVTAQRMDVLYRLASGESPVLVAPWTALASRVPARQVVLARSLRVRRGATIDRDGFVATLVEAGYTRQPLVEERGEVAVRGGIVDLFPPQRARPARLELLGDEVESIREFDPASQRSQAALEELVAPPAREILCRRQEVIASTGKIRERAARQAVPARAVDALLDELLRGSLPPGIEALAPLLQPASETFLDFLPQDALLVLEDPAAARERHRRFEAEVLENHRAALEAGRLVCAPDELLLEGEEIEAALEARAPVCLEPLAADTSGETLTLHASAQEELSRALQQTRAQPPAEGALGPLLAAIEGWCQEGLRVVLAASSLSAAQRLCALLEEYGRPAPLRREPAPLSRWSAPGAAEVRVLALSAGFVLPEEGLCVVTEEEIFGPRKGRRRPGSWREGAALEALAQLAAGDLLVHAEHGIGIYRGLVLLEVGGTQGEFLRLEYEGGDRLFVPVHRLNLVQRFVGAEAASARLDRLGGASWERAKRQVSRSLRHMARQLLQVHAARELAPGHAYPPRDRALEEFEAAFPYEETPDQRAAIEDVLADLCRPRPMDRLVCGDVGYGKTEVAARAAFQVVMAGRQVAILVPTTVLCQQHAETFARRFEGVPARIESLSRFRTAAEARRLLEGLASGRVDIVIGTHRLLQEKVAFHDLGLLVVDEEHRFGVAHKERIKQLKQSVDVLSLTATPIPRTLQMAFTGIRDLSVIQTPPADRLSIRTQVCRFDESLIREAILREVRRGGQVFFVNNRVVRMAQLAERLRRIVPEVRLGMAHGQMRERALEDRMLAFLRREYDVLLCTTIIESGLDIPSANTILIDRADTLGLAQLYQLRGRVGRSSHRAYAYLLIPGAASLSADATRRLQALQDLSELGSGFRLAHMDLEIRGAGNLLGAEPSGSLEAVGYETYMELLERAVEELRGTPRPPQLDPEIRLPVAARLPEDYVPDIRQRLVLYKRLAGASDAGAVDQLRDELLDRFGPLPETTEGLLRVIRLKIRARELGVASIEIARGELLLRAAPQSRVDPQRLMQLMRGDRSGLRVTPDHELRAPLRGHSAKEVFERAHEVLDQLAG